MEKSNNVITCCLQCCVLYSASMISNAAHFHRSFRLLAQLCALLIAEIVRLHSISVIMKPTIHNKITASFINQLLMFVMTAIRSEFKADHGISLSLKTLSMQLPSYKGITCSNMPVGDVSRDPPGCSLPTQKSSARCAQQQQARESWGYNNVAVNHTVWACVRRRFSSVNRL